MTGSEGELDPNGDESAFIQFAMATLGLAANWIRVQGPSAVLQRRTQFVGTSEYHTSVIAVPQFEHWLQGHLSEIAALPETQECVKWLWADGIIRNLLPPDQLRITADQLTDGQIWALAASLLFALADVLQRSNSFEPTRDQVLESYSRFRTGWMATTDQHFAIVPLLNFRAEPIQPLSLSSYFELSTFSDQEKAWVWSVMDDSHESGLIPFHTFIRTEFKLAARWSLPNFRRAEDQQRALTEIQTTDVTLLNGLRNVVTALRLIKPGDVAVTGYAAQTDEVPPLGGYPSLRALGVLWSDFQVRRHGTDYTLEEADIEDARYFVEALEMLDSRPKRGGLDVALRRFNQSYSREYNEDRLIDLTVALESTLLADVGDPKTDLKYRFVLHGAALLAGRRRPQEVHSLLRHMYDVRSAIVHSGKILSEMKKKDLMGLEWAEFAQACEDLTRDILAEYVRELQRNPTTTVQSITKRLEEKVVKGLEMGSSEGDLQR
jgi:hypothetical protein